MNWTTKHGGEGGAEDFNVRQQMAALLSPEAHRVLDLRYDDEHSAAVIRSLGVPVFLRPAPDLVGVWQFGNPWYAALIPQDNTFEDRVLMEVGKVRLLIDGDAGKQDFEQTN